MELNCTANQRARRIWEPLLSAWVFERCIRARVYIHTEPDFPLHVQGFIPSPGLCPSFPVNVPFLRSLCPLQGQWEPFQPTLICCHSPGSCSASRQQGQFSDGINPAQRLSRGSQSLILSYSQCPQQHWAHRTVSHYKVPSLKGICLDVST